MLDPLLIGNLESTNDPPAIVKICSFPFIVKVSKCPATDIMLKFIGI